MKVYRGLRLANGTALVAVDGFGVLVPEVEEPPFEWGTSGSGAVALARAILTDHLGARPARGFAHRFMFQTVSTWTSPRWLMTTTEIETALLEVRSALQVQCPLCGDTGRREVAPRLWKICECSLPPTSVA